MTARERFRTDLISSNRLLADNDYLRRRIGKVRTGDQIRVRGWLANYSNDRGFARASSVTGDGRGDGACETVYVREFSILQPLQNGWCRLLVVAVPGFSCGAGVRGVAVMRG